MKVSHSGEMPTRLPLYQTATAWLLIDRLDAPGWVRGAVGVVLLLIWIAQTARLLHEKQTRIWPEAKP
jgi:hypothetical protein